MKTGHCHLFIPGPTNIPEAVRRAMCVPMEDQRAPDFGELTLPLLEGLKAVLGTRTGRVILWPGSGTAAWEAAIANTLNPGDRVLMARHGQFSALWVEMAERLGLDVEVVDVQWGAGCPAREFERRLGADRHGTIKAVFVTHNETATGVTSDVAAVRRALDASFHDALLFVDGVSSVASIDFRMDDWAVDLAVTGSQKGLMLPAGLAILGVSEKALEASRASTMPRAYFRFEDMLKANATGHFPYTPPTPLFHGLKASLGLLFDEGLDNVYARHRRLAEGVRRAVDAWGLRLCAQARCFHSDTVSTIMTPEGVDGAAVVRTAYQKYRTSFGVGLGPLQGRAFRIGHLGDLNEGMLIAALGVAEMALRDCGAKVEPGSGIAAACEFWREGRGRPALRIAAE